jgi:putative transposase
MTTSPNPGCGFRVLVKVIEHSAWLHRCFSLGLRDVETVLAARGVIVSYGSVRDWGLRLGRLLANRLKRCRPKRGDKWQLDEVLLRSRGKLRDLWRALDQHGNVLDILVQSQRSTKAARRFCRKLLRSLQCGLRVLVTDKMRSDAAARREMLPGVEHRQSR